MGHLRLGALVGVVATALANVVVPGLRGLAPERTVVLWERVAHTASYVFFFLCASLVARAAVALGRAPRVASGLRTGALAGCGVVLALTTFAAYHRLAHVAPLTLAAGSLVATFACALAAFSAPQTRAVGIVVAITASAAVLHLVAWQMAEAAGDRASASLYEGARALSTVAVVLEGVSQLAAATWLGTRGPLVKALASGAILVSLGVAWVAAAGRAEGAPLWQGVVASGLRDAVGSVTAPPTFGLVPVATLMVPASLLLALAAASGPSASSPSGILCALALILLARVAYDVPLRALAAATGGLWVLVASVDDRAMWRALLLQQEAARLAKPPEHT